MRYVGEEKLMAMKSRLEVMVEDGFMRVYFPEVYDMAEKMKSFDASKDQRGGFLEYKVRIPKNLSEDGQKKEFSLNFVLHEGLDSMLVWTDTLGNDIPDFIDFTTSEKMTPDEMFTYALGFCAGTMIENYMTEHLWDTFVMVASLERSEHCAYEVTPYGHAQITASGKSFEMLAPIPRDEVPVVIETEDSTSSHSM